MTEGYHLPGEDLQWQSQGRKGPESTLGNLLGRFDSLRGATAGEETMADRKEIR